MTIKGTCAIAGLGVTAMGKIYGRSASDFCLSTQIFRPKWAPCSK
jgi:hypothetical protein